MASFFRGASISAGLGALLAGALGAGSARADPPQPLLSKNFALDLFQGPLLAPISVTGIAGAYAGYAEGLSGMVSNAAAPAVREPQSTYDFEYDGSASISIPISLFGNDDFDDSGSRDYDYSNFIYATLGGAIQVGRFGAGFTVEAQRYTLTDAAQRTTDVFISKSHVLGAARFLGDQLVVGAGARIATLGVAAPLGNFTMLGAAPELGLLIRPDWESYRFGVTARLPVNGVPVPVLGKGPVDLLLPAQVVMPWEVEVGIAVQLGPRPLNPAWPEPVAQEAAVLAAFRARADERAARRRAELRAIADPVARGVREQELDRREGLEMLIAFREERRALTAVYRERRARFLNWPREHLLLTGELLITGGVDSGVSIQQFLGQNLPGADRSAPIVGTSGASVNFSPRFGVETEPVLDRVHTRFGTYYEPNRFSASLVSGTGVGTPPVSQLVGRQHFTFGADLKLAATTWFGLVSEVTYKLQASADLAPRYQSLSLGFGVWH